MKDFIKNPPTINELMDWKRSQNINPRNKKSLVLKNGKFNNTYNMLKSKYYEIFSFDYDFLDSVDERDPVSLNIFFEINETTGKKEFVYTNHENLILYEENTDILDEKNLKLIRCIEKDSLSHLKLYNITKHPVSQIKIPENVFSKVKCATKDNSKLSVKERSLQVFQILTNISIFIDSTLYDKLTKVQLIKLNYEIKDFYEQNLSEEDRTEIENDIKSNDSLNLESNIFSERSDDLKNKNLESIKFYILDQIEFLISCRIEKFKFMANYIVLAGLSLVIDEVKEIYENFAFNFNS
jgi:hypothetical protein